MIIELGKVSEATKGINFGQVELKAPFMVGKRDA
jgi:hypothetical protein